MFWYQKTHNKCVRIAKKILACFFLLLHFFLVFMWRFLGHIYTENKCITRRCDNKKVPFFIVKNNFFKNSFFISVTIEQKKSDGNIWNITSLKIFQKSISKFFRPYLNSLFNIHDAKRIKFLLRLRLDFRQTNGCKFRHNFQRCINLIWSCVHVIETITTFLLHYTHCICARQTQFNKIIDLSLNIWYVMNLW